MGRGISLARGYHIATPRGRAEMVKATTAEERERIANDLLNRWESYCLTNWDNSSGGMITPGDKVRRFLDSLGTFLLCGGQDDVISAYKSAVINAHEIPVSSCPFDYQDMIESNQDLDMTKVDRNQRIAFNRMADDWDNEMPPKLREKVTRARMPKPRHSRKPDRYTLVCAARRDYRIKNFIRCVVQTDGTFSLGGKLWKIDLQAAKQYAPVETKNGDFYKMDFVIAGIPESAQADPVFFDMKFAKIDSVAVAA